MGQGTDSCGGYEVDYDEYEEGLETGMWVQKDGTPITVSKMSLQHLKNSRRLVNVRARCANFQDEREKWEAWEEIFSEAIDSYQEPAKAKKPVVTKSPRKISGKCFTMRCHCNTIYSAREADVKRGWGLSCSKRCAAIRREFGRPAAKRVIS